MKKFYSIICAFFTFTMLFYSVVVQAESLNERMEKLSQDAAKSYIAPIVSGFGSNLNSGWVHRAAPPSKPFGINVELGLVMMGTIFSDENKSFSTSGSFRFDRNQATTLVNGITPAPPQAVKDSLIAQIVSQDFTVGIKGATIIGSETDTVKLVFDPKTFTVQGNNYTVPGQTIPLGFGGIDASFFPLLAPQLTLGTVFGTQVAFRALPSVQINENIGKFSFFGFGIQHNPKVWIPAPIPVDFSLAFYKQNLKVGDIFETSAFQTGLYVSKTFGAVIVSATPYGGLTYENSKMEVSYNFKASDPLGNPMTIPVSFELEGENSTKLTLGAALKLLALNINVDYNLAKYSTATAGLWFGF